MTKKIFIGRIITNLIENGLGFDLGILRTKADMKKAMNEAYILFHENRGVGENGKTTGYSFPISNRGTAAFDLVYDTLDNLLDQFIALKAAENRANWRTEFAYYDEHASIALISEDVMNIYNYNELVEYLQQLTQVKEEPANTEAEEQAEEVITAEEKQAAEQAAREEATRLWQATADKIIARQAEQSFEENRKWLRIRQKARNKQLKDAYLGRSTKTEQQAAEWIISEQPILYSGTIQEQEPETAMFFESYTADANIIEAFNNIDLQVEDPGVYAEAPGARAEMITALKINEDSGLIELNNAVVDLLTAMPRRLRPNICGAYSMYTVYLKHLGEASSRYDFVLAYEELKLLADILYNNAAAVLCIPIQNIYEYG